MYCDEGRPYALYAEFVGPTDIGWHRPRNDVEVAQCVHGAPIVSLGFPRYVGLAVARSGGPGG
jgi:hypothetical protein